MADRGPGPKDLIRKRITTEMQRLEFQIASQELEEMELDERRNRIRENIAASKKEIEKQEVNLDALDNDEEQEEVKDG